MLRKNFVSTTTLSGLRTRYFPKSRISPGLISMTPWLNLVLLIVFMFVLDAKFVLQPGVVVELPEAPFTDGARSVLRAVVIAVETGVPGVREEVIFFDDEYYRVKNEQHLQRLRRALDAAAQRHPGWGLILLADRRVQLGTLTAIFNIAREAGIRSVNLGTRESATREHPADSSKK